MMVRAEDLSLFPIPRSVQALDGSGTSPETRATETYDFTVSAQGYRLQIENGRIVLAFADELGKRYGNQTLGQLRLLYRQGVLPAVKIVDWPDFGVRGFMLDISRDRVPTMKTLTRLVEVLVMCRINHLELYTEHTFAYADHERVWRDSSPMTAQDVRDLDALCVSSGIELVANQNTFGHMDRWLKHPDYRDRAECPEGFTTVTGIHMEPSTLEPTRDNADFALSLCRELFDLHRSNALNIGCDETFELGRCRSKKRCEDSSVREVYLTHLLYLIESLRADDVEVLFWGDILLGHPELSDRLPREGVTALAWHYEAPGDASHISDRQFKILAEFGVTRETMRGFASHVDSFAESGVSFWVCPGTSSWNSLIGRLDNARGNLLDAAEVGLDRGAAGYLIADWGDNGHMQPLSISWPPLLYGAAVSWCAEANANLDVGRFLDALVFEDEAEILGGLLARIGGLHNQTGRIGINGSPYFMALLPRRSALGSVGKPVRGAVAEVAQSLTEEIARLSEARPRSSDGEQTVLELEAAMRLARHGVWRMARAKHFDCPSDSELEADLAEAKEWQRRAWLGRSRPGGLLDSMARLAGL